MLIILSSFHFTSHFIKTKSQQTENNKVTKHIWRLL